MSSPAWQDYFQPGEQLLWDGAPKPGIHGKPRIIFLTIFGLPFLVIGIAVCVAGVKQVLTAQGWSALGFGLFLVTFSVAFGGVGAAMVFGQWWAAAEAHRKIRYALSTRAAYIAKSCRTRSIEFYPILRSTPSGLEKGRTADTVWFHVHSQRDSDGDPIVTRIGFDNIADGDSVFQLIRSIQTGSK